MGKKILVSGGAGFIGSHTVIELLKSGYEPLIADDFSNSKEEVLKRIRKISGTEVPCARIDVCDKPALRELFSRERPEAVIHFAGFKAVGESVHEPLKYYRNNLVSTLSLLDVMKEFNCREFIFSSSATVYGRAGKEAITEESPTSCTNPYGWTKWMNEQILRDACTADPELSVILLRYFNPIGAHPSGLIGEDPCGIPNNLMPYITQVAIGKRDCLHVFGDDYDTVDGTGVRDYIHVVDLAIGHVDSLKYTASHKGCIAVNLGTGCGYSVLQLVHAFEEVNHIKIPYVIEGRRPGDVATVYANPALAEKLLGWKSRFTLEDMCRDSWNWQKNNPEGYGAEA